MFDFGGDGTGALEWAKPILKFLKLLEKIDKLSYLKNFGEAEPILVESPGVAARSHFRGTCKNQSFNIAQESENIRINKKLDCL